MLTILVVDDEPKILETLAAYLRRAGYAPVCARNGAEAEEALMEKRPALVLLDLMLPGLSGEDLCARVREGYYPGVRRGTPLIMVTAKVDEQSVVRGLGMGADDYVAKPASPREIVARVQALLRRTGGEQAAGGGEEIPGAPPLVAGDLVIDTAAQCVSRGGQALPLTRHEYAILALLASHPNRLFTRDDIITRTLGAGDFAGFDRAVDSHIKNLRAKIGDKARRRIETVYGMGYRFKA